ncbi:MAG: glycosyltransferase family 4 protein [bacterium]|nr:glycosyltransferase family 4 protein [bacterium]
MRLRIAHLATISSWDYIRLWRIARSQSKIYDVEIYARASFQYQEVDGIRIFGFAGGQSFSERLQRIKLYQTLMLKKAPDIIQINAPEMLPMSLSLKRKLGCKVIFDSYEYYPDVLPFASYARGWLRKPFFHWITYHKIPQWSRQVDLVLTSDTPTARYYSEQGVQNCIALMNFPFRDEMFRKKPLRPSQHPELHYGGILTPERNGMLILDAIEILVKNNFPVRMIFTGPPPSDPSLIPWEEALTKRGIQNFVEHRGYVSLEENYDLMSLAKIAVMPTSMRRYRYNIPQKIFYYLGWGVPVISTPLTALKEVLPEHLPGLYYVSENAQELASQIRTLLTSWDKTEQEVSIGQKWVQENCLWEPQEEKLLNTLTSLFV